MVLVTDCAEVLHANHAARLQLDAEHPLQLVGSSLRARQSRDLVRLHEALDGTRRGLRRMVTLGETAPRLSVSLVPLGAFGADGSVALLMMGKPRVCERLSVQWFARAHALTPAETRVLEALCSGLDPREVAAQHRVELSTVRTQIGNLRAKTGAESIRDLVSQVAVLPPMVSALRSVNA
jgi:DNA-binding CsgD family transcriptional regulator